MDKEETLKLLLKIYNTVYTLDVPHEQQEAQFAALDDLDTLIDRHEPRNKANPVWGPMYKNPLHNNNG